MVRLFDIDGIGKAPAFFDIKKLNWINHKYIQDMNCESYLNYLIPIFTVDLGEHKDRKRAFALANQNNIYYGEQLNDLALDFYRPREFDENLIAIIKTSGDLLRMAKELFPGASEEWNSSTIRGYLKQLGQVSGLKGRNFYRPLRVAFSLRTEGFELFSVMECLGRDVVEKNLDRSLEIIADE